MHRNAQVAIEYMIILGFILALMIPLILLFTSQKADTALQVRSAQLRAVGEKIVDQAESVYYLGEPSKVRFKINLPQQVDGVTITNKALIFQLNTEFGTSDIVIPSTVNMTGMIPITSGVHYLTAENRGGYVALNGT